MPTLLSSKLVTARKPHPCYTCGSGAVKPGESYRRETYVYDSRIYSWISCTLCDELMSEVYTWCGRPDEGVGGEDYIEWARVSVSNPEWGDRARAFLTRRLGEGWAGDPE